MSTSKAATITKGVKGSVIGPGLIAHFDDQITLYAHNGDELLMVGKFDKIADALSALDRIESEE